MIWKATLWFIFFPEIFMASSLIYFQWYFDHYSNKTFLKVQKIE
jgi:hypothetical protein